MVMYEYIYNTRAPVARSAAMLVARSVPPTSSTGGRISPPDIAPESAESPAAAAPVDRKAPVFDWKAPVCDRKVLVLDWKAPVL